MQTLRSAVTNPAAHSILFMVDIKREEPEVSSNQAAPALPCYSSDLALFTPVKVESFPPSSSPCLEFEFCYAPLSALLSTQPNTPEVLHLSSSKVHRCKECLKIYSRAGTLKVHMRKHTGERPFECLECGKRFAEKGNLSTHQRIHSGERPYKCSDCQQTFTTQGHLTDHRRTHTGDRPFECKQCKQTFKRSSTLKIHERRHTGDRPYPCPHCEKAFTESGNLRTHIRTHVRSNVDWGKTVRVPVPRVQESL